MSHVTFLPTLSLSLVLLKIFLIKIVFNFILTCSVKTVCSCCFGDENFNLKMSPDYRPLKKRLRATEQAHKYLPETVPETLTARRPESTQRLHSP